MKTIGLLGGMSWQSTSHYYRLINQGVSSKLGGLHSAKLVLLSVDFHPLEILMQRGEWTECGRRLADDARKIERAGADFLVICTNTMHKVAAEIEAALSIPILHIGDAAAQRIKEEGLHTVGLLGTRFTMEESFYVDRLEGKHGLSVIVPDAEDRRTVHDIIFNELCRGQVTDTSRNDYLRIMDSMRNQGAEAVIAGCTEIGMLLNSSQTSLPLFDTTEIHASHAVRWSLSPIV